MKYIFRGLAIALVVFCLWGAAAVARPAAAQEIRARIYEATPRPRPPSAPKPANAGILKRPSGDTSPSGKISLKDQMTKQEHFEKPEPEAHDQCEEHYRKFGPEYVNKCKRDRLRALESSQ
jgi:hypothetical protein